MPKNKIRVAINGFGRIGRAAFKIMLERKKYEVVAVNDLAPIANLAYLLRYDSVYGVYPKKIGYSGNNLIVNNKKYLITAQPEPKKLPWKKLQVDVVIESTGIFITKELAGLHLQAGAKKVVLSAPSKGDGIKTYVRGINCGSYKVGKETVIDNASCTTNCTAPVMRVMEDVFGVEKAMLTTVHSYTADQNLQDGPHKDLRRARAACQNIVPTSTGAAIATTRVIPELENKFDGIALRVPTITGSLTDFTLVLKKDVTVEEVNKALIKASKTSLKGILVTTDEPIVSSDIIGNTHSSIVDLGLTHVVSGNMVKIISWYDNEWGYANRLVEMVEIVGKN